MVEVAEEFIEAMDRIQGGKRQFIRQGNATLTEPIPAP
jgi:hypothetical protein